jgi:hypothetical protein
VCQWQLTSGQNPLPRKERDKILQLPSAEYSTTKDTQQDASPFTKTPSTGTASNTTQPPGAEELEPHAANVDLFRNAYPRPYRKWTGNSLAIFRELSNVVVSGTHIIEDSQLLPSISALNCTLDASGNLVFPSPEKEALVCPLTGKNLDKISKLRLRNAKDATDTSTAEAGVTVNGDSSNATATFVSSALHSLPQAAYDIFTVSGQGVEQKTPLSLHLPTDPYVSQISPASFDYSKDKTPENLTITGNHLQSVDTVILANADASKKASIALKQDALKTDTKLLVQIDPSALSEFGTTKTTLTITLAEASKNFATGQHFDYTGTAQEASTPGTTTPKTTGPTASKSSPPSFDFSKDSSSKPLTLVGTNLLSVTAVVFTNPDKSKKVTIPVKKDQPSSATQLIVQIDPSELTTFGTTKTTLTITLTAGAKAVVTPLHFEYTGAPSKAGGD